MSTQKTRIVRALRAAGHRGLTTGEIMDAGGGRNFPQRLAELRALGYVFSSRQIPGKSTHRYWMTFEPGVGALLDKPGGNQPEGAYTAPSDLFPHEVRVTMNGPTGRFTVVRFVGANADGEPDLDAAATAVAWRWHDHYVEGVGVAHVGLRAVA